MGRFRRIGFILLSFILSTLLLAQDVSYASNKKPSEPTIGEPSKNPKSGEGSIGGELGIKAKHYLLDGETFIEADGATITVSGNTQSLSAVDTIAVDLYLQRWDTSNSEWDDVVHIGEYSDYNTSLVSGGKSVSVISGYYRTRAHHSVIQNGIVEQEYSNSTYIYIK